jgi:hypothetical protein
MYEDIKVIITSRILFYQNSEGHELIKMFNTTQQNQEVGKMKSKHL